MASLLNYKRTRAPLLLPPAPTTPPPPVFPLAKLTYPASLPPNPLFLLFHPTLPHLLHLYPTQILITATTAPHAVGFTIPLPLTPLCAAFHDAASLEAYSLLPPALVGDCPLNLVLVTTSSSLVVFSTASPHTPPRSYVSPNSLSGPMLAISCLHTLLATASGTILAFHLSSCTFTSFSASSHPHASAPITALAAVPGHPSTQLHRARFVSGCAKGVIAVWELVCSSPLTHSQHQVIATLHTRVVSLSFAANTLFACLSNASLRTFVGDDLAASFSGDKSYGPTVFPLDSALSDTLLTVCNNSLFLISSVGEAKIALHAPCHVFAVHPHQPHLVAVAAPTQILLLQHSPRPAAVFALRTDRTYFLRAHTLYCIQASTSPKPSPERLLLTLPPKAIGSAPAQLFLHQNESLLLIAFADAHVLIDVSDSARILDTGKGWACFASSDSLIVSLDSSNLVFKSAHPPSPRGSSRADFDTLLSSNGKDLLLVGLSDSTCRVLKTDKMQYLSLPALGLPACHAWSGSLLALHYPEEHSVWIVDCAQAKLFAVVSSGLEPLQSLILIHTTLVTSSANQIRLAFCSRGCRAVDSIILVDRGRNAIPSFIPVIDKTRRTSLHLHADDAALEASTEDADYSPSPSLLRPFDERNNHSVPPPVSRTGTSFVALLGLKGSRLYLLQDYKVAWVSLEHPMLMLGFLASRRLPDRAVEWAGALAQGEPRNDALLLLERMGFPNHACRVPGVAPWLLLDVCIKHQLFDIAALAFDPGKHNGGKRLGGLLDDDVKLEADKGGLGSIKRLGLLLLQGQLIGALKRLVEWSQLPEDDLVFLRGLLGEPPGPEAAEVVLRLARKKN